MGTFLLIVGLIVIVVIFLIGLLLYAMFGKAGIIVPAVLLILIACIVNSIGLENILIGIVIIVTIKKTVNIIQDIIERRRSRRLFQRWDCSYREESRRSAYQYPQVRIEKVEQTPVKQSPVKRTPGKPEFFTNNCPNCGGLVLNGICQYCNTRINRY